MNADLIRLGRKAALAGMLLTLVACGQARNERILFEGQYFPAKTSKVGDDLSQFVTVIDDVSSSLDGAREAGRYEGTKYCIANFGTSRIDWVVGPDTPPEALTIRDNTLTFQGRCRA